MRIAVVSIFAILLLQSLLIHGYRERHMNLTDSPLNVSLSASLLFKTWVTFIEDCILICMTDRRCRDIQISKKAESYIVIDCRLYAALDQDPYPWDGFIINPVRCVQGPFGSDITAKNATNFFDDAFTYLHGPITKIMLKYGELLDTIQVTYGSWEGPIRGSIGRPGGVEINLTAGEYITKVILGLVETNPITNFVGKPKYVEFHTNIGRIVTTGSRVNARIDFVAEGGRLIGVGGRMLVEKFPFISKLSFIFDFC